MTNLRKLLSCILTAACVFSLSTPAAVQAKEKPLDPYQAGYTETIEEGGQTYHFRYFVDRDGNNAITVQGSNETDHIVRDSVTGTVYLNGDVFSTAEGTAETPRIHTMAKNKNWIYFDRFSNHISWPKGAVVAVVAGAIAIGIGSLATAEAVIAAMGYGSLSVLSAAAIGGTVSGKIYKLNTNLMQQFRCNWTFKAPTKEKLGPYVSIFGS